MDKTEKERRLRAVLWIIGWGFSPERVGLNELLYTHERIFQQGEPEIIPADSDEIGDRSGCKACGGNRMFYAARKDTLGRRYIQGTCKDCLACRSILQAKNAQKQRGKVE